MCDWVSQGRISASSPPHFSRLCLCVASAKKNKTPRVIAQSTNCEWVSRLFTAFNKLLLLSFFFFQNALLIVATKFESNYKALSVFTSFEYLTLELRAQFSVLVIIKHQPPNIHQCVCRKCRRWSHLVSLDMTNYPQSEINIHVTVKSDSKEADESALNFLKNVNEATAGKH